eukprot:Tbor_TRINITY_DN6166_c0_g2::TRINITY_DN6166_c0_g2_i1::g.21493::m.21493/K14298/RAE1, GLE2; mRNA export factor
MFGRSTMVGSQLGSVTGSTINSPQLFKIDGAPDDTISSLKFSPEGCPVTVLGCTSWDGTVRAWTITNNGQQIQGAPIGMQNAGAPLLAMTMAPEGKIFYGGVDRKVMMWDLQSQTAQQVGSHDLAISSMEYVHSGGVSQPFLMTGSWDGTVRLWDLRSPQPAKVENFGGPVFAMDAQSSSPLASFALGRKVILYHLQQYSIVKEVPINSVVKFGIRCISNSPDRKYFVYGSSEGRFACSPITVNQNPSPDDMPISCFKAHYKEVSPKKFIMHQTNFVKVLKNRSSIAISGGGDGTVKVWRLNTKNNITEFDTHSFRNQTTNAVEPIPISAGDATHDGNIVAIGNSYDWAGGKEHSNPAMERIVSVFATPPSWK